MNPVVLLALFMALGLLPAKQPHDRPPPTGEPVPASVSPAGETFRDRLETLRPDDAAAYFLLGEEVADAAENAADTRLAVELHCLAFELARASPYSRTIAAEAAIALAELDRTEKTRRWLFAMARLVDPTRAEPEWMRRPAPASTESQPYQAATLLGLVRSGDGTRAKQLLAKADLRESLVAIDRLIASSGVAGGVNGLQRESARWPCLTCGNKLIVRRPNTVPPEYRPCSNCGGNPGPSLSADEFILQLRLESWLLQGLQRSWAAQIAADRGEPLIDPDPAALCSVFDVAPDRVYWRSGRWCITPECADPPPKAPPPPPPTVEPATNTDAGQ